MSQNNKSPVHDLRSAIARLQTIPGEYVSTDTEVNPEAELSGVYRYVGAGGTCERPTRKGPAMMFNQVKGFPGVRVVTGMMATRERVGHLLDCPPEKLGFLLRESVHHAVDPVLTSGGGKLLAVIQFKKASPVDEGRQRQAAIIAFAAFPELKNVILVDEDVDIFDTDDILWAMQTRYQGDIDTITIPGVRCHPLDPSQMPEYSASNLEPGMTTKTVFDCTVPFHLKHHFERSKFMHVDVKRFLPDFE
ncbi:UbiD family decarboxylase domain-containing protein [Candidatus Pantoea multigeneris]|uniref:3-octaprenyl-4-hydroxybenzoate carboxy-lyase n=1 Tax=Candidatus Pantoea multigeneris TaxID=2608357 RepID=A0ABX0RFW5_9GAMM|nr:UbiD family decarboxylase domain-containing protein [Pantoea multigeneris]NIF23156.1 hypothetical protein [Pantoea multigeneris]